MNILISYSWLKDYLKTNLSPEEFAKKTTTAGNSVEHIDDVAPRFDKMVVGVIKELKPHPQADRLRIAMTDIGSEVVQIVCGGVNLSVGQRVVVAVPGSKVRWHGEGDLVELKETEIRGEKSFGMICAAEEIGFEKLASGDRMIWDISSLTDAPAGTPVAKALGLDDHIFDIEVTTNRPDAASIIGQAREGHAATGEELKLATGSLQQAAFGVEFEEIAASRKLPAASFRVSVLEKKLCPKYEAVRLDGVKVGPSPWWLQRALLISGHRPINNIVDVTNYVLHEYGQPLHTFDAATLKGGQIVVRKAKKGEKIIALDGNEYELGKDQLVIADAERPIAVAGVMGGSETGTTAQTTSVIIESATFDPVSIRRTSRALNLSSDSSQLFEKGLSQEATRPALARAVELILKVAGGQVASQVATFEAKPFKAPTYRFRPADTRALMGVEDITDEQMYESLRRLGFGIDVNGRAAKVTVPYWRARDIEDPRDLTEEIARLYDYGRIPSVLPTGELTGALPDPVIVLERRLKECLRGAGFTEAYSYSFTNEQELSRYSSSTDQVVAIENPLSADQSLLRPSLIPTMLTTIEANQGEFKEGALFEIAPTYLSREGEIPDQSLELVVAVYGKDGAVAFRQAKGILERVGEELGYSFDVSPHDGDSRWHAGRSARVQGGGKTVGSMGEIAPAISKAFGLDARVTLINLSIESLSRVPAKGLIYEPIPTFPETKRDMAFVVADRVEFLQISQALRGASPLVHSVELFDVYRGAHVGEGKKSLAVHLALRAADHTLTAAEADTAVAAMGQVLVEKFGGIMR
ncbi:phenylalanine--tRNA ligase subunit beta [Candidatus Uhrbacteria bacterium]|nr:phenylalanine--tRNA ligase subunit beta [Candidatus Uhrbacteria bacterium]